MTNLLPRIKRKPVLRLSLLIVGAFLLVNGVSCKPKTTTNPSSCSANPGSCESVLAAKDYFLFKEGSWWVYEEETSHQRDSLYVFEYNNTESYDFDMRVRSSLTGYEYHYWPLYVNPNNSCNTTSSVSARCLFVNRSKGKAGDYVGEDECFFINFKIGDYETVSGSVYYTGTDKIIVDNIFPSYNLGNLLFSKTVKIHELSTLVEGIQPTNHYFSKGVGLIRKELLDSNQVWNLVNYYIEN